MFPYNTCVFLQIVPQESLEYLLSEYCEVHFTILAHTIFLLPVVDLQRYLNLLHFFQINSFYMNETSCKMDFYLDINHEGEIVNIL